MELQAFSRAFARACEAMGAHTEELCRLDSYIGDGDHGVTIARGFRAAAASLAGASTARELFFAIGESMSDAMGGAIGPLYGMFWRGVGKGLDGADITPQAIGGAWQRGCEALMRIGRTSPGDKTIADAILPSVQAAQPMALLSQTLSAMADAAEAGAKATAAMQASKGRAHFLMEKSIGTPDPGACSYALFMRHLARETAREEAPPVS